MMIYTSFYTDLSRYIYFPLDFYTKALKTDHVQASKERNVVKHTITSPQCNSGKTPADRDSCKLQLIHIAALANISSHTTQPTDTATPTDLNSYPL